MDNKKDKNPQQDKFIEAARELGCDESEEAFNENLGKLATVKLESKPKPRKGTKNG